MDGVFILNSNLLWLRRVALETLETSGRSRVGRSYPPLVGMRYAIRDLLAYMGWPCSVLPFHECAGMKEHSLRHHKKGNKSTLITGNGTAQIESPVTLKSKLNEYIAGTLVLVFRLQKRVTKARSQTTL